MMKRIFCLFLAFVMVFGILPTPSFADEITQSEGVSVWFSASTDDRFFVGAETDEVMVLKNITVPYFDLALYGLEEYYFVSETYSDDGDGQPGSDLQPGTAEYAEGKITMLHLFLYATEIYECGLAPEDAGQGYLHEQGMVGAETFSISGGCGSSFLTSFWGHDSNLNYYLNYAYPLASDGWGATCDQILMREGDIVTLGHFTSWAFCWDTASVFNFIEADNTEPDQGDVVKLTVKRARSDFGGEYTTIHTTLDTCPDVYYCLAEDLYSGDVTDWIYLGAADDCGEILLDTADLEPGEYIIAMAGQYGNENPEDICSAPGAVRLTVVGSEPPHEHAYEAAVTAPTCTEGGYTTYTCACGDSYVADETDALGHSYENGSCANCGEADPDFSEIIAEGWSGYTTWTLTSNGVLTFIPTEQDLDGQTNLKNYWKVNGVLTLPWGEYAGSITTVVIEDGIHDIGQMAFYELKNLTTVVLGADVTEIRNYAFKNCASLTTINLEHVDDIREGAFYGCAALENIVLGENVNIEDWAFTKTPVQLP